MCCCFDQHACLITHRNTQNSGSKRFGRGYPSRCAKIANCLKKKSSSFLQQDLPLAAHGICLRPQTHNDPRVRQFISHEEIFPMMDGRFHARTRQQTGRSRRRWSVLWWHPAATRARSMRSARPGSPTALHAPLCRLPCLACCHSPSRTAAAVNSSCTALAFRFRLEMCGTAAWELFSLARRKREKSVWTFSGAHWPVDSCLDI
jgi:hypothetical protein